MDNDCKPMAICHVLPYCPKKNSLSGYGVSVINAT